MLSHRSSEIPRSSFPGFGRDADFGGSLKNEIPFNSAPTRAADDASEGRSSTENVPPLLFQKSLCGALSLGAVASFVKEERYLLAPRTVLK